MNHIRSWRWCLVFVAASILTDVASAQPYNLTTGVGDGNVSLGVDGYGAFGSAPGADSTDATYDPIGPTAPIPTMNGSGVALRIGAAGPRAFLTSGMIGGTGGLPKATVTGTATTGTSNFNDPSGQLSFTLVQTVAPTFNGPTRLGAVLTQTYTIRNISAGPLTFELCRCIDTQRNVYAGNRFYANDRTEILYADETPINPLIVGISGLGGIPQQTNRYQIKVVPNTWTDLVAGTALNDSLFPGPPFNVNMAFRNVFTLAPGASDVYTTHTVWGSPPAANVIFPNGPAPPAPGANVLYGVDLSDRLFSISTTPQAGRALGVLIGPMSTAMQCWGIASYNNKLYAWDSNASQLRELDATTGATINSIAIGVIPGGSGEGDIVFRSDGVGFMNGGPVTSQLRRFDLTPGSLTLIANCPRMNGLAFNSAGVLIAISDDASQLVTIDTTTAATTPIGPTGITGFGFLTNGGLTFDPVGNLYTAVSAWPPGPSGLFQVNPATGAASYLGDIGFDGISGLRYWMSIAVPPGPVPSSGEGTYNGARVGNNGNEGCYGFGGGQRTLPLLFGPLREGNNDRVHNIAFRQATESGSSEGFALLTVLLLGALALPLVVLAASRR